MWKSLSIATVITLACGTALSAQPTPPKATVCSGLQNQWRDVEMELAEAQAMAVGDNSAPRATMRATQSTAALANATVILELMRSHSCDLPKRAPSAMNYATNAALCTNEIARSRNPYPQACDRKSWTPRFKD